MQTLISYDFKGWDLPNLKRKVWDLQTIEDVEMFLMWNSLKSQKQWNQLLDYIEKNLSHIKGVEEQVEIYRN